MKHISIFILSIFFLFSCDENEIYDGCTAIENYYVDADGDGYGAGNATAMNICEPIDGYVTNNSDCDDTNATVNVDQVWYQDLDADTYGNAEVSLTSCQQPDGYVLDNNDCNDEDASITNEAKTYYLDEDGDGYGAGDAIETCMPEDNYVENNDDCDDLDASTWQPQTWYEDADGDGLGNPEVSQIACDEPDGYVDNADDTDDGDSDGGGDGESEFGYYYPLAIGNSWSYSGISGDVSTEVISVTTEDGVEKYTTSTITNGETQESVIWYDNNIGYAAFIPNPIGSPFENVQILDDNVNVGESWSQSFEETQTGVTYTFTYDNTVEEILDTYTVNEYTFIGVKRVTAIVSASDNITNIPVEMANTEYYWARGVGNVHYIIINSLTSEVLADEKITDWNIQ